MKIRCYPFIFLFSLLFVAGSAVAQREATQLAQAQQLLSEKQFDQAIPIFKSLYQSAPFDKNLYDQYRNALMEAGAYHEAEKLVTYMMQIRRGDPAMLVDLGMVYETEKKKSAARKQYEAALETVDNNEFKTKGLAAAFENYGKDEYAAAVYERARKLGGNPYLYATQLAMLYTRLGDTKKAIKATLDLVMGQVGILEEVKNSLAHIAQSDPKGFSFIRRELESRLETQPENPFWNELISWLFVQKGDYEGAYTQLTVMDQKLGAQGKRIISFAKECLQDGAYVTAVKSYDYVLKQGADAPYYETAFQGKITALLSKFESEWPASRIDLPALEHQFQLFFTSYPNERSTDLWRQYAMIYARYDNNADSAIKMLQEAIAIPGAAPAFIGRCKLDMGDYYVLVGKVWDATLIYAQVDKAFKEDYLGEQARFRNARLAYYRGDFEWAQGQLSVLKASTTRLIANDALYLSVLITENIPPDSNITPLLRFAKADLLLFQHKTKASDLLLDSIATSFPQSPLQDDIAMLRAKIAIEEGRWNDAVTFLEEILQKYATDILGDDAALKLARIFKDQLHQPDKALYYYELLINNYPGSTYIQEARKEYIALKQKEPQPS